MLIGEYTPGEVCEGRPQKFLTLDDTPDQQAALQAELRVLLRFNLDPACILQALQEARRNHTTIEQELLASNLVSQDAYYAAMAQALDLPFLPRIDSTLVADSPHLDTQLYRPTALQLHDFKQITVALVPQARQFEQFEALLKRAPNLSRRFAITTPSALRQAVWQTGAQRRVKSAIHDLFDTYPHLSARIVFYGAQGFCAGACLVSLTIGLLLHPGSWVLVHLLASLFYFSALVIRLYALQQRNTYHAFQITPSDSAALPVYTVLVALYREATVVPQLVSALKKLNWPVSKLDIKLVCEADDTETITALKAQGLGPQFEIVEVPPMQPRTKPKALNYALKAARGELTVIYDAEDRPHPDQLREAYKRFQTGPDNLACLQAPLVIDNGDASWITSIFSLEYSALFRALLPMLANRNMPLPLGGTSNHFKTTVLKSCGAWDPFNVTEDADLGMRLYRFGYRHGVLTRPTKEDAPVRFRIWRGQRTRWFKGWLQTWLVLMRHPFKLKADMGLRGALVFQLLIGGMLLSALAHPWLMVSLLYTLWRSFDPAAQFSQREMLLFILDSTNIAMSYLVFGLLGKKFMVDVERQHIGWRWMAIPLYWFMLSLAAWQALFELRSNPFFWNKTPHHPSLPKRSQLARQDHKRRMMFQMSQARID